MRISIFVPFFPPKHFGGFEIASDNIANYLTKTGHEVHVLTRLDKGLPKESMKDGFYVHRVYWPMIRIFGGIIFWIKMFWNLKKIEPDIIHIQAFGFETPIFLLIKRLLKKPCVIWAQGSDVYVQWMFKEPISKIIFKKADAIIALTDDMKNKMKNIYARDIDVLPNGIDLCKVKCLSKQNVREELGIQKDRTIILFSGALTPIKGLTYLIEAITYIKDKNKQLILVGDGEERDKLEDLVKKLKLEKYVIFIGKVPYDEVFKYMVASDIFVLSSLSEGLPNVILEAMASGLPIVATRVGGIPDIIKGNF